MHIRRLSRSDSDAILQVFLYITRMELHAIRSGGTDLVKPSVYRISNFYPLYGSDNDQVDRVSAVKPPTFQKIIPRYRLSTSETRDQGTGPVFEEISSTAFPLTRRSAPFRNQSNPPLRYWQGNRIDLSV